MSCCSLHVEIDVCLDLGRMLPGSCFDLAWVLPGSCLDLAWILFGWFVDLGWTLSGSWVDPSNIHSRILMDLRCILRVDIAWIVGCIEGGSWRASLSTVAARNTVARLKGAEHFLARTHGHRLIVAWPCQPAQQGRQPAGQPAVQPAARPGP